MAPKKKAGAKSSGKKKTENAKSAAKKPATEETVKEL